MRNIKYIGTKATEDAFFDRTQIIWTPGKIDTVLDEAVATEMLRFAEFEDAGDAVAGAGVAVGALALDPTAGLLLGGAAPNAQQRAAVRAGIDVRSPVAKSLAVYNFGLNYGVNASLLGDASGYHTVESVFETDAPFFDAAVLLHHYGTAAITIAKAEIAAAPDTNTTAYSTLTRVALTFDGSATKDLPERVGTNIPSSTLSDRLYLASVARTDGGSGYIYRCRIVYQGSAGAVVPFSYNITQETFTDYKTATGKDWQGRSAVGDGIANPALTLSATLSFGRAIGGFVVGHAAKVVNHAAFGDSITGGQQQSLASARSALLGMTLDVSTSSVKHVGSCYGWNGSTSIQYFDRFSYLISLYDSKKLSADYVWWLVSTQNDSDSTVGRKARTLRVIDECFKRGIKPVMVGPVPLNGAGAGTQATIIEMRQFAIDMAALHGLVFVDQYLALGNSDLVTVGYRAEFGVGAHPNEAGQQALRAAWTAASALL